MDIPFSQIGELLKSSYFEKRVLKQEVIRRRTAPIEQYGEAPGNLPFIDWEPEDDRCTIEFSFEDTEIGRMLFASTHKGICFTGFARKGAARTKLELTRKFPKHPFVEKSGTFQQAAVEYCNGNYDVWIPLHLKGNDFQAGIWKQLARIPSGKLSTYGSLAPGTGWGQAVGQAVGANPISYLIPCHRVVKADGNFDGYRWGSDIKRELLAYESPDVDAETALLPL